MGGDPASAGAIVAARFRDTNQPAFASARNASSIGGRQRDTLAAHLALVEKIVDVERISRVQI